MLFCGGLTSFGSAEREPAMQELAIGTGGGQVEGFPPGAPGGGMLPEAEMELADHGVPAWIVGGNAFRSNGKQAIEAGLRAVQVRFGDSAVEGIQ